MPFTFSHPAIILPAVYLPRKWYSLSGLIMGSMVPDFEYFIRMKDIGKFGHNWIGVFWFDTPLALLLLFIFHNLVRNTLIHHLPLSMNVRLSIFEKFNWNKYFSKHILVVLISIIVGAASHLIWDDFTHTNGYFVGVFPTLNQTIFLFNYSIPICVILQYVCSLLGLLVMLIALFKLPEGIKTKRENILNFWLLATLILISVVATRILVNKIFNYPIYFDILIVTTISGGLIGIIILSFFLKESKKVTPVNI